MAKDGDLAGRLGVRIRRLRKARGLSLDELSAKADVDGKYLGGLERGVHRNPSLNVISHVADALGVDVAALLDVSDELDRASLRHVAITRIRALDEPDLRLLLRLLNALGVR